MIGKFAFKFPRLNGWNNFLYGCYCNNSERQFYKKISGKILDERYTDEIKNKEYLEMIAPSYFCLWFGLLQIQARCEVNTKKLTKEQKEKFNFICSGDDKKENFGFYCGKLVCLDYA